MQNFERFFERATGFEPFHYQVELAEKTEFPSLLEVPTGMGKTASAILGWLWRRRFAGDDIRRQTQRRLVYCLPMRVLVEQTRDCAVIWLNNLGLLGGAASVIESDGKQMLQSYNPWAGDDDPKQIRVHLLMGGEVDRDWDRYPERDAILVGTQDMLLSRALNRGYAMSRFRWPMQFGFLNNDCLWIMDEIQLMGNGLATTTQLQAHRRILETQGAVRSLWMSATMHEDWLNTVDFDIAKDAPHKHPPSSEDRNSEIFDKRYRASKHIEKAVFTINDDGKETAQLSDDRHVAGTRTIVVVNTVRRAQNIYQQLMRKKNTKNSDLNADIVLLHSRFREPDRDKALSRLLAVPGEQGIIAVCTQVIEAGVDVSAKTLITDLAPWSSLVQRFGRCNRYGEYDEASIIWIAHADLTDKKKVKAAPYNAEELQIAAERLSNLTDAGPAHLPDVHDGMSFTRVLRLKDLIELFDTTPDLAGADIDISRFIRDSDENGLQIFWREITAEGPTSEERGPDRQELCTVPISKELKGKTLWRWDHLGKKWEKARSIYPGLVLLIGADQGGYSSELGWTGKEKTTHPLTHAESIPPEGNDDDKTSFSRTWQTIAEHTDMVLGQLKELLLYFPDLPADIADSLIEAARWHDAGKAHPQFQSAIPDLQSGQTIWGKSALMMKPYERKGFRHELASSMAMLVHGKPNLAVYLAAAHHGRVRLSIRSLPEESRPPEAGRRFARGVWEGDVLPEAELCTGLRMPETALKLSYMEIGEDPNTGPSWLERMLNLRNNLGPFRLAYLESILRVADWRASADVGSAEKGDKI